MFFYVSPPELQAAIQKAGSIRDDTVPSAIRGSNSDFKKLAGDADQPSAIGFRRADLNVKEGKICQMLCAPNFTWAYLIYINYGNS